MKQEIQTRKVRFIHKVPSTLRAVDHGFFAERILDATDPYEQHFGMKPQLLSKNSRASVQDHSWKTSREKLGKLGSAIVSIPDALEASAFAPTASTSVNTVY